MSEVDHTTQVAEQDGPHMRRCFRCGRCFGSRRGADQHIASVHKGKGHRVSARWSDRHPDRELSMGELVAEAQMNRLLGEPVDPIIADMFDV